MTSPRLMVDAYGCERARLEDLEWITQALQDFAAERGLVFRREPQVFRFAGETAEDWGLSSVATFKGSRLTIHTYPSKFFFSLDFCPPPEGLDTQDLQQFLRDRFGARTIELNPLSRGI